MAKLPITEVTAIPARIVLNAKSVRLDATQFFRLCADNPDLNLELTAQNEIVIMPPIGGEGSARNFDLNIEFGTWVKRDGTGIGFDSSAGFTLPNGAVRSPDGAWIRRERWEALSKKARAKFAPICPDFVMELHSPSNSLRDLKAKMDEYIANGAQLGWLIDPFQRSVHVYRPGKPTERLNDPKSVSGEPLLHGFILDLTRVW